MIFSRASRRAAIFMISLAPGAGLCPRLLALYEDVRSVYMRVMAALEVDAPFKRYQRLTDGF